MRGRRLKLPRGEGQLDIRRKSFPTRAVQLWGRVGAGAHISILGDLQSPAVHSSEQPNAALKLAVFRG